jgi:hypothetical protein
MQHAAYLPMVVQGVLEPPVGPDKVVGVPAVVSRLQRVKLQGTACNQWHNMTQTHRIQHSDVQHQASRQWNKHGWS